MNGDLAQSVALVSYGNAYLRGQVRTTAWSEHSTFRFVATTRFFLHHRMWMVIPQRTLVAESAEAWLEWLRRTTATVLRLEITSKDRWVVRTESAEDSYVWRQKSRYIGGAGRGWEVTYHGHIDRGGGHHRSALDIATAASNLNRALDAAIHLTHTGQLVEWERRFAAAKATLLAEGPVAAIPYHADLLAPSADVVRRLAVASVQAWVFGGQDSWSDQPLTALPREPYKQVTRQLYGAVLDAIAAAANNGVPSRTDFP